MAYKISDSCISCGACAAGCPCDAISEGAEHFEIDADKCIGCKMCMRNCPADAIHVNPAVEVKEGKKLPYLVIDTAKCVKCGACISGCKFKAISKK